MSAARRVVTVVCAAAVAMAMQVSSATAHVDVAPVRPPDGAMLEASPRSIVLRSSEPVTAKPGYVQVLARSGEVLPARVTSRAAGSGTRISIVPSTALPPGYYAVRWAFTGGDGHEVSGASAFGVRMAPTSSAPSPVALAPGGPRATVSSASVGSIRLRVTTSSRRGTAVLTHARLGAPITWELVGDGRALSGGGILPLSGEWRMTVQAGSERWSGALTLR